MIRFRVRGLKVQPAERPHLPAWQRRPITVVLGSSRLDDTRVGTRFAQSCRHRLVDPLCHTVYAWISHPDSCYGPSVHLPRRSSETRRLCSGTLGFLISNMIEWGHADCAASAGLYAATSPELSQGACGCITPCGWRVWRGPAACLRPRDGSGRATPLSVFFDRDS